MHAPKENRQRCIVPVEVDGRWEYFNIMAHDMVEARTVAGTLAGRDKRPGAIVRVAHPNECVCTGDRS